LTNSVLNRKHFKRWVTT